MRRVADERAVSTALGYVLTLSIATLLVSGLLVGLGDFVETQRQETVRSGLEVVGQQLAENLASADRLAQTGSPSQIRLVRDLPDRVTGASYVVEVTDGPTTEITIQTENPEVTVTVGVVLQTDMAATTQRVDGGDVVIELAGGDLEVRNA